MRQALVNEILAPRKDGIDAVVMMMKDQYGSESRLVVCLSDAVVDASFLDYVLQRALSVAEGEQKETLIKRIRPHLINARRQGGTYGKHLIASEYLLYETLSYSLNTHYS